MSRIFYRNFDYADGSIFLVYQFGSSFEEMSIFTHCFFTVEYPVINKFRLRNVDIPNRTLWMRKAKGLPESDKEHWVTPFSYGNTIYILAMQENEIDPKSGELIYFPVKFDRIKMIFFSQNNKRSFTYEEIF